MKKSHEGATIQRRVVAFTVLGNSANSEALLDRQIQELSSLLGSLGCTLLKFFVQYRKAPDPQYYVGKGKILEIQGAMEFLEASTAVVDGFLTPARDMLWSRFSERPYGIDQKLFFKFSKPGLLPMRRNSRLPLHGTIVKFLTSKD